ncbi:MAG TPA: DUF362 domain-containing protein [Methanobacterium sp.]|nr:DUF362 domain-containing protein [Methanobacterium sp.]
MQGKPVYVNGIEPDPSDNLLSSCIEDVFLNSTDDLKWLKSGDIVLLKPALNSGNPYPSTTHRLSIQTLAKILTENGAKVVIGDQSGIRNVLHDSTGVIYGNSRDNYVNAGMSTSCDRRFIGFEEEGWDEGFFHYSSDKTSSWPNGFYVTNWIHKADHIINLPRLSTHVQAGATLGFKNMIGIIRDDSRMDYHANGPFNFPIKFSARRSKLKSIDDKSDTFFEKIVEISDSIRKKLRLTLFVATKAQTTFGPNKYALEIGKSGIAKAHIMDLNPGMVFGSADPVAAEAFALALLKDVVKSVPFFPKLFQRLILFSNRNVTEFGEIPVKNHFYIQHAMKIGLGEMPSQIIYDNVPMAVQDRLNKNFK